MTPRLAILVAIALLAWAWYALLPAHPALPSATPDSPEPAATPEGDPS